MLIKTALHRLSLSCLLTLIIVTITSSFSPKNPGRALDNASDNPLKSYFEWEGHGNVIVKPISYETADDPAGTFVIEDIPAGSNVVSASFAVTAWPREECFASSIFNNANLDITMPIEHDPAQALVSCLYRWDVTRFVSGNGYYSFTSSDICDCYLAYLVVIYENPSLPRVRIAVNEGSEALRWASSITRFHDFDGREGTLILLMEAAQRGGGVGEKVEFNDELLLGSGDVFVANLDSWADYFEFEVDNLQPENTLTITTGQDYLGFHLAILTSPAEPTGMEIGTGDSEYPDEFSISGPYPNPFNPTTTISFDLPVASNVELDVFDIHGRRVGIGLAPTRQYQPGHYQITFDGSNITSGVYIYRLQAGEYTTTGKMVLMK